MKLTTYLTRSICLAGITTLVACGAHRPQAGGLANAISNATAIKGAEVTSFGSAELWDMNCARCHNLRSRAEYSPAQWAVVVNHMRIVADLPGEDYRALLEYLADRQRAAVAARPARRSGGGSP